MVENLFPPIPSEIILTFSGFISHDANLNLFLIIIFATIGSDVGALILYYLGYFLKEKIGPILHLNEKNFGNTLCEFNTKGKKSVFFGRLVPIIRSLISIPAGISKMNILLFLFLTTLGSFIWNGILVLLGNMIGENYALVSYFISKYYKPVILIVIVIFIIIRKRRKKKIVAIK